MKKLKRNIVAITLIIFFAFINNIQANQLNNETTKDRSEINSSYDKDITITVTLTFGRASRDCKGFGICKASISVSVKKAFVATNNDGHFVLLLNEENMKEIKNYFKQDAIILEEDFVLPNEITKKLKLKNNYVLKKGKYIIKYGKDGNQISF